MNIVYLYVASYVFQFCNLYRLALTTVLLVNILAIIDTHIGISFSDLNMLRIYVSILIIGILAFIKFHVKDNQKHSSKVR